eukprot:55821-Rhodomonas_salina.1
MSPKAKLASCSSTSSAPSRRSTARKNCATLAVNAVSGEAKGTPATSETTPAAVSSEARERRSGMELKTRMTRA